MFPVKCRCPPRYPIPETCCCMPCGKLAYPGVTAETENARICRLRPITDHLELDLKNKIRVNIENRAEIKKTEDQAKFRTSVQMEERGMDLERRADRLKRIIEDDMFTYTQEIVNEFEHQKDSKIEVMRQRVKALREKREEEDKIIVAQKLEQAFQNSCEQLRTLRVQKMAREITKDWKEQIKMKERLECEEEENDRMYAYLWLKDAENKLKREQAYDCVRMEHKKQAMLELNNQTDARKERLALLAEVHAKEQAMNQKILDELEEERQKFLEEKKNRYFRAKEHVKDMMETREFYKNRKLKREEIVALEFLKKAIRELYVEQEDRNKAKRELRRAIDIYKEYLRKRDCEANTREQELQKIIDHVIEEQYQKVTESRRREQAQRRRLFCNVMKGRAKQMEDLKKQKEDDEARYQLEVQKLKDDWKEYLRDMEREKMEKVQRQQEYRNALDHQVHYKCVEKERDFNEFWREEEVSEMQEEFFKHKLKNTIDNVRDVQTNPFRDPLVGKHIKQCLRPV